MRALGPSERRFVIAFFGLGARITRNGRGSVGADAAYAAGYGRDKSIAKRQAWRLLRNPKIEAAIEEEAEQRKAELGWRGARARHRICELMESGDPRIALKACVTVLEMSGYFHRPLESRKADESEERSLDELTADIRSTLASLSPSERELLGVAPSVAANPEMRSLPSPMR
jgi:hypothetical protein